MWKYTDGNLLRGLKGRALATDISVVKDIPSSPEKLGLLLGKHKSILNNTGIRIDRGTQLSNMRILKIVYKLSEAENFYYAQEPREENLEVSSDNTLVMGVEGL